MMNFLKYIRRRMFSKEPTSSPVRRYLYYAIGEIILVVIGILIAIQINNWNEYRKKENAETQLYHKILNDLNSEYAGIEREIKTVKSYQDLVTQVYRESKGEAKYDPTAYYNSLLWIHRYNTFFNDKYANSLSLITTEKIHERLKAYINQENVTKNAVDDWNEFKLQDTGNYLSKHGIKNTKEAFSVISYDFNSMTTAELIVYSKLKDHYGELELDQLLFTLRFKTFWMLENLFRLKDFNRALNVLIRNEEGITEKEELSKHSAPRDLSMLLTNGKTVDEIIEIINNENPNDPIYDITETTLNYLGYDLMDKRQYREALKIFKLGTELFPEDSNAHDSHGECLFQLQEYKMAEKSYRRALELNPENKNASRMLTYILSKE